MISYISWRKYLYIKHSICVWSWTNFKEFHPLVIKIWACILRVGQYTGGLPQRVGVSCLLCKIYKVVLFLWYILWRRYLYTKDSICVWSWTNFKEFHPLVIKIWATRFAANCGCRWPYLTKGLFLCGLKFFALNIFCEECLQSSICLMLHPIIKHWFRWWLGAEQATSPLFEPMLVQFWPHIYIYIYIYKYMYIHIYIIRSSIFIRLPQVPQICASEL